MQITTHLTKICSHDLKNTGWEWTVHWCNIYNTCYSGNTWSQIRNLYFGI